MNRTFTLGYYALYGFEVLLKYIPTIFDKIHCTKQR